MNAGALRYPDFLAFVWNQPRHNGNRVSIPQQRLIEWSGRCRMTVYAWFARAIAERRIRPAGWLNRCRVYELAGVRAENCTCQGENCTCREKPQANHFFTTSNKGNNGRPSTAAGSFSSMEEQENPETVTGEWLTLRENVQARTGETLARWQLGYLFRECRRAGAGIWQLTEAIAARESFAGVQSVFAVLVRMIRNGLKWLWKRRAAKSSPPPPKTETDWTEYTAKLNSCQICRYMNTRCPACQMKGTANVQTNP